ncbi:GPI transamidase component Gpi16 subunit family protein [Actinidia rufa]|uniref:GPI transamidase component Gpi16 subunit family protein n=1 Tax=Actinidia rufa TaxID=165716 RepID=A0A7J0H7D1_9ERIC|nr:GPI transamidase component Gpi16 subunit family protein [Actinidia rufa]
MISDGCRILAKSDPPTRESDNIDKVSSKTRPRSSGQKAKKDQNSGTGMSGSPKKGSHGGKYTWAAMATRTPSLDSTERRHLILMPETPTSGLDARRPQLRRSRSRDRRCLILMMKSLIKGHATAASLRRSLSLSLSLVNNKLRNQSPINGSSTVDDLSVPVPTLLRFRIGGERRTRRRRRRVLRGIVVEAIAGSQSPCALPLPKPSASPPKPMADTTISSLKPSISWHHQFIVYETSNSLFLCFDFPLWLCLDQRFGEGKGNVLEQTLTVVLKPNTPANNMGYSIGSILQPSWSLSSILGKKVSGKCLLAKSSNVYLQLEGALVSELNKVQKENERDNNDDLALKGSWRSPGFELSVSPDRVIKELNSLHKDGPSVLYEFLMENYSDSKLFDLGFTWKFPVVWSCPQAPLHSSRFLMGSGNERGAIALSLISTKQSEAFQTADINGERCSLQVDVFQVVPWYVKVYYHTLQVFVDEQLQSVPDVIKKMRVSPSEDKVSPGVMEMVLKLPCGVKSAVLTIEFDKGFLHIDEYPPDANQGFDIPSAVVSFPEFQASLNFLEDASSNTSPLLSKLKERSPVLSYTEVLLVPLTTPDFSMPYNVITITCTVFALYFGSLLNVLRRRVGEEERLLKSKAAKKNGRLPLLLSKLSAKLRGIPRAPPQSSSSSSSLISSKLLIKVVLAVGVAAGWQYYFG